MAEGAQSFDVVVIGAGPGGYVAALRAAARGLSAAVVERDRLGGVCANQGCIPTKALLRSAEVFATMRDAASFGIRASAVEIDLAAIVDRARKTASRMEKTVEALLRAAKVPVLRGDATLDGRGKVRIKAAAGESVVCARHIILATGARAKVPPGMESDGRVVWTYPDALVPPALPGSLAVVGAGAIGVEFASFFRTLGSEVTLIEMQPRILPLEDADIGEAMQRAMKKQGVRILTGATVSDVAKEQDSVSLTLTMASGTEAVRADRLLVATGIAANVEGLGLEQTRVRVDRGHVVVDEWLATGEEGIYAIGDLTGPPWLAHKASREAVVCIDRIAGAAGARPLIASQVPSCTYARPQAASVGLTEAAAKQAGRTLRIGRATFVGNGKARALGETDGFCKTLFDATTGELVGAHLIGPEVTELIPAFALALAGELTEAEILATVFPHPTLSEVIAEAVEAAFPVQPAGFSEKKAPPARESGSAGGDGD
ncbi:MAG TPA: dihydrolipoyl dehydrogenase [Candidatus Binatia bacterium]|jgi:dihydrolipoamide dehydrogenase